MSPTKKRTMSLAADTALFDSAMHQLFRLPETLEKIAFPTAARLPDRDAACPGGGSEETVLGSVPVDILEFPKEYTFILDVPSLSKSDIQDEKILVIKGGGKRKRDEGEEEGCRFLRLERRTPVKFARKFQLPEDANSSAITAKCENGVLTVIVGKTPPPVPKTKTVQVKIA